MMSTMAETISARYGDDGQRWTDADGVGLEPALRAAQARPELRPGTSDVTRWTLPDGSVITAAGDGWDYGYPACWCWRGAGHVDSCPSHRPSRAAIARSLAARVLGAGSASKAGKAGRGASKSRGDSAHYRALAAKSAAARRHDIAGRLAREWDAHGDDAAPSWDAVVALMVDDIRERVHLKTAPCTQREFFAAYSRSDGGALGRITQW
jgi:hypothetical protein